MRVLVVEDEKKTASFIRKTLQAEGHAVEALHDGSAALTAATGPPSDVLVLDVMPPGRDGLDSDGHKRVTTGKNSTPVVGSQETHEEMTGKAGEINGKLAHRGKELHEATREEFDEIAHGVGLRGQPGVELAAAGHNLVIKALAAFAHSSANL